ncbi:MAG: sulfatase-like hydrolase/transferase [Verrucomicrobia bacterium]|nr:sulfatase-like hydrolase/transferase [Verrucomicrobiota bacterium]MCH8525931.1 sulfatase-like hydrolase/transferase [Kiritimatiellia bacterium]
MMMKPNILFLISDQQRADTLGVLNPAIRTPNLDRLAGRGTVYTRCYPTTPVCLPCRASLLSGRYPSAHGAMHNFTGLRPSLSPMVADRFRESGYYTHMIGKSHVHPCHQEGSPESAPHIHDRDYFRNWRGPWYGFEHADLNIGHSTEKHACGMHYGVWLEEKGIDTDQYFGHTRYDQYGAWDLPEEVHNSAWIAETTIEAMRRSKSENRPFYISANFQDPHNPCMLPEPWASMYDPKEMPDFGFKPGEPECFADKPPFYQEIFMTNGPYAAEYSEGGPAKPTNAAHLAFTPEQARENAACYYGMVSLMDHHIGRILDELEAMGELENTIVVFTSDHGDFLGDHGLWWKELYPYEESLRVPCIVSWPGQLPENRQSDALVGLIDFAPTWLKLAGLEPEQTFQGVDQTAVWTGERERLREAIVVEDRPGDSAFNQRVYITDRYKLVAYTQPAWGELYDMENDPHQVRNLWSVPDYSDLRFRLMQGLLAEEMNRNAPYHPVYPQDTPGT